MERGQEKRLDVGSDNSEARNLAAMDIDWRQVIQTFLQPTLAFCATLGGVFFAFYLDRLWDRRLDRTKALEFLRLVRKELDDNCGTLRYLAKALRKGEFESPFFAVRFTSWHTFLDRLPLIQGKLRADMMTQYYELETHDRTVTLYRGLVYASYANEKAEPLKGQVAQHRDALLAQIGEDDKSGLLKSIPPVIQKIDDEIKRLSDC